MEKEEMKHFYNTVELTHSELLEAQGRAISQELKVFNLLQSTSKNWTAWELKAIFSNIEITSLRRSLHNLEKLGAILKTGFVPGPKGKPCGSYKVNNGLLF